MVFRFVEMWDWAVQARGKGGCAVKEADRLKRLSCFFLNTSHFLSVKGAVNTMEVGRM